MISVCMALHNGEEFLRQQIDSILPQLAADDEVVISDDGSCDNSLSIVESYADKRLKIIIFRQLKKQKHSNVYAAKNFENSIKSAKGDYIFLCDQDDIWMPTKVAACLEQLKKYDLVQHNLLEVDNDMKSLGLHFKNGFQFNNYFIKGNSYHGCAIAFRREIIDYILPFPSNLALHDYWIGMLTEIKGKVKYIDEPLMYYRLHGKNISQYNSNSLLYKISHRLYIMFNILLRLIRK